MPSPILNHLSDQFDRFGRHVDAAICSRRLIIGLLIGLGVTLYVSFPEIPEDLKRGAIDLRDRTEEVLENELKPSVPSFSLPSIEVGSTQLEGPFTSFQDDELNELLDDDDVQGGDDAYFNCFISDMGGVECDEDDEDDVGVVEPEEDQFAREIEGYIKEQCIPPIFSYLPPVFYNRRAIFETEDVDVAG